MTIKDLIEYKIEIDKNYSFLCFDFYDKRECCYRLFKNVPHKIWEDGEYDFYIYNPFKFILNHKTHLENIYK